MYIGYAFMIGLVWAAPWALLYVTTSNKRTPQTHKVAKWLMLPGLGLALLSMTFNNVAVLAWWITQSPALIWR